MQRIIRYKRFCLSVVLIGSVILGGCAQSVRPIDPMLPPPTPMPSDPNVYRVVCTARIPSDRTVAFCPDEGGGFCTRWADGWIIFPPELNPNLVPAIPGARLPTRADLEADAANRVSRLVTEGMRFVYGDCRPQVTCVPAYHPTNSAGERLVETRRDIKGDTPCPFIPLIRNDDRLGGYTNVLGATCVLPTNQGGCPLTSTLCGCRLPRFDPPFTPPDGLLSGFFGSQSVGEITTGTANITVGSRPEIQTAVRGSIELTGGPCPGRSCNVGLAINWKAGDVKSGNDTLSDITLVGAGEYPGASLDAAGAGTFAPGRFYMTVGATGSWLFFDLFPLSGSQAFYLGNSDPVRMTVGWESGLFTIDGNLRLVSGPAASPTPALNVRLHVEGRLLNRPPTANIPGTDEKIECTSPEGAMISLSGLATDLDGNILSQLWKRDPARLAEVVGAAPTITLRQRLGPQTYAFQAIDTFFQTSTDARNIMVQDTVPPELVRPLIEVPCGWGGSCDDPKNPKMCMSFAVEAKDACSSKLETVIKSVQAFLGCTGKPLGPPQQDGCIRADPAFRGDDVFNIVYVVKYTLRDESGNETPLQTISFSVTPGGGDESDCPNGCNEPRKILLNPCRK